MIILCRSVPVADLEAEEEEDDAALEYPEEVDDAALEDGASITWSWPGGVIRLGRTWSWPGGVIRLGRCCRRSAAAPGRRSGSAPGRRTGAAPASEPELLLPATRSCSCRRPATWSCSDLELLLRGSSEASSCGDRSEDAGIERTCGDRAEDVETSETSGGCLFFLFECRRVFL